MRRGGTGDTIVTDGRRHGLPSAVACERPHLSRLRRHQLMAHPTCTDEAETVPVEDGYRAKRRRRTSEPLSIGGEGHHRVEGAPDRDARLDCPCYGGFSCLRCCVRRRAG